MIIFVYLLTKITILGEIYNEIEQMGISYRLMNYNEKFRTKRNRIFFFF